MNQPFTLAPVGTRWVDYPVYVFVCVVRHHERHSHIYGYCDTYLWRVCAIILVCALCRTYCGLPRLWLMFYERISSMVYYTYAFVSHVTLDDSEHRMCPTDRPTGRLQHMQTLGVCYVMCLCVLLCV